MDRVYASRHDSYAIRIIEFWVYQMFYRVTFRYFKFENSTLIGFQQKILCVCKKRDRRIYSAIFVDPHIHEY